jgi:hypothetical protein
MELREIADITEKFINLYGQFEVNLDGMCKKMDASLWTEDMRFLLDRSLGTMAGTEFEAYITAKSDDTGYDGKACDHIKRMLYSRKISVKTKYQNQIPEERLLELAVLRLVAGAVQAYVDPIRDYYKALKSGVAKTLTPSKKAQKAAQLILDEFYDQGIRVNSLDTRMFERIARGEHPKSLPQVTEDNKASIKILVREVSLLSKQLFIINNSKESRFPVKSIQRILDVVGASASPRTIADHQSLFDKTKTLALSGDCFTR